MAPSLVSLGLAALTLGGHAAAIEWKKVDSYNPSNFFEKFEFITRPSDNAGFSTYVNEAEARNLGMVQVNKDFINLGVESKKRVESKKVVSGSGGRSTFRLESHARFNKGLFIARFTHLPKKQCGAWPAFWTFGDDWPNQGEVDIYEGWNFNEHNKPVFHVGNEKKYGRCRLRKEDHMLGKVETENCDNDFGDMKTQWPRQGCVVEEKMNPFGSDKGGVYAMEWTKDFIKIYVWTHQTAPKNIDSDSPDTALWGRPVSYLDDCNVDGIFKNQRLVLNVELCGNPVQEEHFWGDCKKETKKDCRAYVAESPEAFKDVYWGVKDIRIFEQADVTPDVKPDVTTNSKSSNHTALPETPTRPSYLN